ncbi:MAG: sigma-70 family RNA polymerase sigma factor [Thermoanaerobaculia bacterium]|nr:sigma-70 family RNA polymerase sigma factor [Thermoanaerobaculia bacterium]
MTEKEMLSGIASGDAVCFETFYDEYSPTLYAVLLKMLGDRSQADDVLQETFSQVWRTAGSFDARRGSAIGWLISIGRSRALDRLRAGSLRSTREQQAAAENVRFSPNGDQMSGFRHASMKELREAVLGALTEIPDEQKTAIELAYYKGMTQKEIAKTLGQPLGTVKTRILLGMKKLKSKLRPFHKEYESDSRS